MPGMKMSIAERHRIMRLYEQGANITQIAAMLGRSRPTVGRVVRGLPTTAAKNTQEKKATGPDPIPLDDLCVDAKRSLTDFAFFFKRYVGPVLGDWDGSLPAYALEMAQTIGSGEHEFLLVHVMPGAGKTTWLQTYVLWRVCQDRNVKVVWLSKSEKQAKRTIRWLAWHFENNERLIQEFGRFKPVQGDGDTWSRTELSVDGASQLSKEATVSVYGAGQAILGTRVPLIIADDVVDSRNSQNADDREKLAMWWETEVETRLEPPGVLAVVGSRLGPNDLYAELASARMGVEEEDEDEVVEVERPLYHVIKFKAHDEAKCPRDGTHPEYPDGCLLWPQKWSYKRLMFKKRKQSIWDTTFQQEDVASEDVLALREWIEGGVDRTSGETFVGCLDVDRSMLVAPVTDLPLASVVTVDPSPTRFWSVQWWLIARNEMWWLMDMERRRMGANEILDLDQVGGELRPIGLLDEWCSRAQAIGHPIRYIVVESNAAQKWLLQTRAAAELSRVHSVSLIPHATFVNKADPKLGVWALGPRFHYGKIRIPHADPETRGRMQQFVREMTTYPNGATDDCVMAAWFALWNEQRLVGGPPKPMSIWKTEGRGAMPRRMAATRWNLVREGSA